MDQINYSYGDGLKNQLTSINDAVGVAADTDIGGVSEYTYDGIGNLISDSGEEIKKIVWTVNGKVKEVIRKDGSGKSNLEFYYDAMGNRVMKVETPANTTKTIVTWYSRDASGNVMATYKSPEAATHTIDNLELTELPIYGSSRLGILTISEKLSTMETLSDKGNKYFELSNHLGNVLSVVSDRLFSKESTSSHGLVGSYTADRVSATDYYAFGMPMPGRTFSSNQYRYGFNGMEKDDEMGKGDGNSYDFGARFYDPRLGRWLAVDPLAAKYPYASPYNFVLNSPLIAFDPDGKIVTYANDETEKVIKDAMEADPEFAKTMQTLINSDVTFNYTLTGVNDYNKLSKDGSSTSGGVSYDGDVIQAKFGKIENSIQDGSLTALYHETEHLMQFEHGESGFKYVEKENEEGKRVGVWIHDETSDITDEVKARTAGYKAPGASEFHANKWNLKSESEKENKLIRSGYSVYKKQTEFDRKNGRSTERNHGKSEGKQTTTETKKRYYKSKKERSNS